MCIKFENVGLSVLNFGSFKKNVIYRLVSNSWNRNNRNGCNNKWSLMEIPATHRFLATQALTAKLQVETKVHHFKLKFYLKSLPLATVCCQRSSMNLNDEWRRVIGNISHERVNLCIWQLGFCSLYLYLIQRVYLGFFFLFTFLYQISTFSCGFH